MTDNKLKYCVQLVATLAKCNTKKVKFTYLIYEDNDAMWVFWSE